MRISIRIKVLILCLNLRIFLIIVYDFSRKMSFGVRDICEDTKMAREYALLGNYETALVYYQGAVQQIHRLLTTITDSIRKERWQQASNF